ncbi:MAG TPA: hypothetical protein VGZ27_06545 [Vicinamibacterales bacterium]|jgi:intracellular sulfur oxidation DsrE/DsrF family protein|nr:hypothetical protein [Vicinamibacterales bacterium]
MVPRRSFLSRLGISVPALGGAVAAGALASQAQAASGSEWQAARHAQDDWLDQLPGKHRMLFDTTTAAGLGQSLRFANNFFNANKTAYGLQDADLAVIIVVRHNSTPFAFNDAIWAKYGGALTQLTELNDPKTKEAPTVNLFNAPAYGGALPNQGNLLDGLLKRGVQLAVCQLATSHAASTIAAKTGGETAAITAELVANRVTNSRMVPAGIVAVNRAQERGYAFAYAAGV